MIKLIRSPLEMTRFSARAKARGQKIALVPTMGALHEGHLSLVAAARDKAEVLVVSIFVNPLQFGPQEDLKKYPRNLDQDKKLLSPFKPLILFNPSPADLYQKDHETRVEVKNLSQKLCGQFRPGHFEGVTTVVAKLFNVVRPDLAFFGEKDYQQQLIIKKMVKDLNYGIEILTCPTVREYSGLALSSRNQYLTDAEKKSATVLYRALTRAKKDILEGSRDANRILTAMRRLIGYEPSVRIQYISIVHPETLEPVTKLKGKVLIALAVHIGKTRLIDNLLVEAR